MSTTTVPREFLPALIYAATVYVAAAADGANLDLHGAIEHRAKDDELIEPLTRTIAERAALLRAYDDHDRVPHVPLAVLRACTASAVESARSDLALAADSRSTAAEEIVKLAQFVWAMSAWADEHGLIEREASA